MQFNTAYNYEKQAEVRKKTATMNKKPSLTKQNLAENLDVNNIIKKYNKAGVRLDMMQFEGVYGEFNSMEYRDAVEMVDKADELFLNVPSKVRAEFDNDPGRFIDFATNPDNLQQMRDWGLAHPPKPEPIPQKVEIVNPPDTSSES